MQFRSLFRNHVWFFAWVIVLFFASPVCAIDLLVYNNNDSGAGSLRQAIIDNNNSTGGNIIVFSNVVTGTITLTSGELLITRHGQIRGPGSGFLAVNGNAASRVIHVAITNDAAMLISGLTITNGAPPPNPGSGGGIWNDHSILVVENCAINGNMANLGGGIWNDGASSSRSASLVVRATTVDGNLAPSGGGIWNSGYQGSASVSVTTSTFSSNTSVNVGAGIWNDGTQGSASTTVNASTFSSNVVTGTGQFDNGGGIHNQGTLGNATLFVSASTFSGNSANSGGSIFNNNAPDGNTTLTIGNTILQAGASGGTISNRFGTVTSAGFNLSSDTSGGVLTNSSDKINLDPLLGPLANNGGPTFTHALLAGSPAIDQGKANAIPHLLRTDDQRGAPKPFNFVSITNATGGDGSDIGAFELGSPNLKIQQVGMNAVLSWPSYYGDFSLESSTNIASSNSWISAGGAAFVVGNQYQQTNEPISSNRFFRLRGN